MGSDRFISMPSVNINFCCMLKAFKQQSSSDIIINPQAIIPFPHISKQLYVSGFLIAHRAVL